MHPPNKTHRNIPSSFLRRQESSRQIALGSLLGRYLLAKDSKRAMPKSAIYWIPVFAGMTMVLGFMMNVAFPALWYQRPRVQYAGSPTKRQMPRHGIDTDRISAGEFAS